MTGARDGRPAVLVLGDVMVDVLARIGSELSQLAYGSDTPARISLTGGGSAANTACWLATAGARPTLVGAVGDDPLGQSARAQLAAAGVRAALRTVAGVTTGTCLVLVSPDGERSMLPDAGANTALRPADLPVELFADADHLHLSGYSLLGEETRPVALAALELARTHRLSVSVDAASAAPLVELGPERFLAWTAGAWCLANLDEARVLTGLTDPRAAAAALTDRYAEVVVKLGADGALWAGPGRGEPLAAAAEPVQVVDTTGAGDAFAAGFLAARLAGSGPHRALAAGATLAARAVGAVGARPG